MPPDEAQAVVGGKGLDWILSLRGKRKIGGDREKRRWESRLLISSVVEWRR